MSETTVKIPPGMLGHGMALDPETGQQITTNDSKTPVDDLPALATVSADDMVVALVGSDLNSLSDMAAITYIATAYSDVQNALIQNVFAEDIEKDNDKIIENNAWSSAMQQAIGNDTSDYDNDTKINLPPSITLPDGTTSNLQDYLEENDMTGYLKYGTSSTFAVAINEYQAGEIPFSEVDDAYWTFMSKKGPDAYGDNASEDQSVAANVKEYQEALSANSNSYSIPNSELGQPITITEISSSMTYGQLQQVISSVIPNNTQTITAQMNTSVNNMQEIVSAMDTFFSNLTSLFNYFSGSAFANVIGK